MPSVRFGVRCVSASLQNVRSQRLVVSGRVWTWHRLPGEYHCIVSWDEITYPVTNCIDLHRLRKKQRRITLFARRSEDLGSCELGRKLQAPTSEV